MEITCQMQNENLKDQEVIFVSHQFKLTASKLYISMKCLFSSVIKRFLHITHGFSVNRQNLFLRRKSNVNTR